MRGFSKKERGYDSYVSEALQAIRSDDGVRAQELAAKAYDLAPNSSQRARMARDIGNACRHRGDYDEARKWATEAVEQHRQLVEEAPNRSTLRELGASTAMLATIEFSQLLRDQESDATQSEDDKISAIAQNYRAALDAIIQSRQHTEGLNRRVDQYEINFTDWEDQKRRLDAGQIDEIRFVAEDNPHLPGALPGDVWSRANAGRI